MSVAALQIGVAPVHLEASASVHCTHLFRTASQTWAVVQAVALVAEQGTQTPETQAGSAALEQGVPAPPKSLVHGAAQVLEAVQVPEGQAWTFDSVTAKDW